MDHLISSPRTGRLFLLSLLVLLAGLATAASATASVTQAEIDQTVAAGGAWLRTQQVQSGGLRGFNGDWATTTLAAAGINAADVRGPGTLRSLQDYWAMTDAEPEWAEIPSQVGPGQIGKAALIGWSAGLQPTRISAEVNLAADLASIYDAETGAFGGTKATNALGFALLAMPYLGMPAGVTERATEAIFEDQTADGGWNFGEGVEGESGDTDMTGAALAMVCSNGFGPGDPRVAAGLQFLHEDQNQTTGVIESNSPFVPPVNAPTLAWALIGIQACGEDPQGANWTTAAGTNPIEFALQNLRVTEGAQAGAILYEPASPPTDPNNINATEALVRALAGDLFSADPPAREDPSLPAVRPAPAVAAGTPVPIALTIEDGAGPARMCAVKVPNGTPLVEALRAAEATSVPAGCVTGLQAQGPWVTALDGGAATDPAGGWVFSTPGSAEHRAGAQPVEFGDVVRLRLSPGPLPGVLTVSPTALDFGSVTVGADATRTFTLSDSLAPVHVDSLAISGSGAFKVAGDDCDGTLAVGAACTVTVRYAPGAAGSDRGTLTVNAADADEPTRAVALAGSATPTAAGAPAAAAPIARRPRIRGHRGPTRLGRHRVAVLATLLCPSGAGCRVRAPRRVRMRIGHRRFAVRVLVPRRIAPGARATLRVKLPRPAARALRRRSAVVAVKVRLSSAAGTTRQLVRRRVRA